MKLSIYGGREGKEAERASHEKESFFPVSSFQAMGDSPAYDGQNVDWTGPGQKNNL